VECSSKDFETVSTSTLREVNLDVPYDTVCDLKKGAKMLLRTSLKCMLLLVINYSHNLINIHEQTKQRHWCKQRHVSCARMRGSSKQLFRLAECYVPR